MEEQKSDKYDNFLVKKGTVRYKFVIVLFILSFAIFHPETIHFMSDCLKIDNKNLQVFLHATLFSLIVYMMLKHLDNSLIFSPCNIELDINDILYYVENEKTKEEEEKNIFYNK